VPFNRLTSTTKALDLFWSDASGASGNDYDLFVLNPDGTAVIGSSVTVQDGDDDPFEEVFSATGFPENSRVVIAARAGAAPRALHLSAFFNEPLAVQTAGAVRGHGALPSVVTVTAVAWNSGRADGGPFTGGQRNPTESNSADGVRRMFYGSDGAPITPGNLRFATAGGTLYVKPDLAAADGVTVRTPGFSPFFGTGAAAAHAAGIAALIKSAKPWLTPWEIREAMTSTALDIRAPGVDRDAGYGIVMAPSAVAKALQMRFAVELTAHASNGSDAEPVSAAVR
jgi:subtilisin family serine protease